MRKSVEWDARVFHNPNEHKVNNMDLDCSIYTDNAYLDTPKEYFGLVLDAIFNEVGEPTSLLDIGCANGAFLHHARKRFTNTKLDGLEPISHLASLANRNVKTAKFHNRGLLDVTNSDESLHSEVVTMLGVLYLFRDPEEVICRLMEMVQPKGGCFIFGSFNEEPIDILTNYRRAPNGDWVSAHNLFSMATMENICTGVGATCRWRDFSLSVPIPKSQDPMRSWTEPFRGNPHHIIYGTNTFHTMKLLIIRKI